MKKLEKNQKELISTLLSNHLRTISMRKDNVLIDKPTEGISTEYYEEVQKLNFLVFSCSSITLGPGRVK